MKILFETQRSITSLGTECLPHNPFNKLVNMYKEIFDPNPSKQHFIISLSNKPRSQFRIKSEQLKPKVKTRPQRHNAQR